VTAVAHPLRQTCAEVQPVDHGEVGRSRPPIPPLRHDQREMEGGRRLQRRTVRPDRPSIT
jgi:hypothetical protein